VPCLGVKVSLREVFANVEFIPRPIRPDDMGSRIPD
jgi:hypothetical protein